MNAHKASVKQLTFERMTEEVITLNAKSKANSGLAIHDFAVERWIFKLEIAQSNRWRNCSDLPWTLDSIKVSARQKIHI